MGGLVEVLRGLWRGRDDGGVFGMVVGCLDREKDYCAIIVFSVSKLPISPPETWSM